MKSVGKYELTFSKAKGEWGLADDKVLAKSLIKAFLCILSFLAFFLGAMGSHCIAS